MSDSDRHSASNRRPILKSTSDFPQIYVFFSNFKIDVNF